MCGQHDATVVVLELGQGDVLDVQTTGEFGHRQRIHVGGVRAPSDQRGYASQRGLLAGQLIGFPVAFLGLGGAQPGLTGEHVGQQRQREEHEQRRHQTVAALEVEIRVDRRAHH